MVHILWVVALSFVLLGGYYFMSIEGHESGWMRRYKNLMGVLLIGVGCLIAMEGFKAVYDHKHPLEKHSPWLMIMMQQLR